MQWFICSILSFALRCLVQRGCLCTPGKPEVWGIATHGMRLALELADCNYEQPDE